jgi:hypothetical protein
MAAGATTATLTTGNFGSPVGKQIITIDGNVAAKAADFDCTIAGTAITAMVRLNGPDVEHAAGCQVSMNFVDEHANMIFNALDDGWVDPNETPTKGSGQTLVFAGVDRTSTYRVGDFIKLTDTTEKFFQVITSAFSTNTTLTLATNADYTLVGNPTAGTFRFSHVRPNAFPDWFAYVPTFVGFTAGIPTYTAKFSINGRLCTFYIQMSADGTSNATNFTVTAPVANAGAAMTLFGGRAVDNGSVVTSPPFITLAASSTITCYPTFSAGNWTNANGKRIESIHGSYRI